jgi:hypothetical protein
VRPITAARGTLARKLDALVEATIELAFVRHDLYTTDGDDRPAEVRRIVDDVQGALRGEGTCSDEPAKEWSALFGVVNHIAARLSKAYSTRGRRESL